MKKGLIYSIIAAATLYVVGCLIVGLLLTVPAKFTLGDDSYGGSEFIDLTKDEYESKISNKDTFIIFVDSAGCVTADRVRGYVGEISSAKNIHFYHIMWPEAKQSSMHEQVKYYPSVVIIKEGKIVDFLKADEDAYAEMYSDVGKLRAWLDDYIEWRL